MIMIFLVLITIIITTIIVASLVSQKTDNKNCVSSEQSKQKEENKNKILEYLKTHDRITNDDVEALCKVSDNTAERYLNELEQAGLLIQHGKIGRGVYYTKK